MPLFECPKHRMLNRMSLCRFASGMLFLIAYSASLPRVFAQANLPIYTDRYVNAFQDWGWGTRAGSTNAAVGTNSLSLSGTAWNVAFSAHHSSFDSSPYSTLSFRAHGGTTGGQVLRLFAHVTGADLVGTNLPALSANTWKQYVIPLANLNAANRTNLEQFTLQLTSNGNTNIFYLDDIYLGAKPAPAITHISLNATQALRGVDWRWFGINTAIWDGNYDFAQTTALLNEMGTRLLRGPGGSLSDEYHWSTDKSLNNTWTWVTSFANFVHVATNAGAQAIITVNYGSSLGNTRGGQAKEAAAWVAYANGDPNLYGTANDIQIGTDEEGNDWRSVGFWARLRSQTAASNTNNQYDFLAIGRSAPLGIKYWEIGNENYGTWERDFNTNAPYHSNEGWTYATRASNFFYMMRLVDPTIKIGVPVVPGDESYNNNYVTHPAYNSRTATNHYGWTPTVLSTLKSNGVAPDFVIHHVYPQYQGPESDPLLLQYSYNWAADAKDLRQQIADYYGAGGENIEMLCTENNSNSGSQGRQSTSLVNGLYYADSLAQLMKTEFNSFVWWDLRNSSDATGSFDPSLYGWRTNGDLGLVGGLTNRYPPFYAAKMFRYFAQPGDSILNPSSDYLLLSAYAARRTNGSLSLLVLNKDSVADFPAEISISGYLPDNIATIRSFGVPQDEAARTNAPYSFQDIGVTNISNASTDFTYTFPRLSLTLFTLLPEAPGLSVVAGGLNECVLRIQGQPGVPYVLQQRSDPNAPSWTSVSTNVLVQPTLFVTNIINPGETVKFWRALWQP